MHRLNSGLFQSSGGNIPACWRELSGIISRPFVTACAPNRFTAQIRTFKLGTMAFPDCIESLLNTENVLCEYFSYEVCHQVFSINFNLFFIYLSIYLFIYCIE
jgi:hypothetical protein